MKVGQCFQAKIIDLASQKIIVSLKTAYLQATCPCSLQQGWSIRTRGQGGKKRQRYKSVKANALIWEVGRSHTRNRQQSDRHQTLSVSATNWSFNTRQSGDQANKTGREQAQSELRFQKQTFTGGNRKNVQELLHCSNTVWQGRGIDAGLQYKVGVVDNRKPN